MRVFVVSSSLHFLKTISQLGFFSVSFILFHLKIRSYRRESIFLFVWSFVLFFLKFFDQCVFSVCDCVLYHLHNYLTTKYFLFCFSFGFCPTVSLNSVPWVWLKALPLPSLSKIVQFHHMLSHCDRSQEVWESFFSFDGNGGICVVRTVRVPLVSVFLSGWPRKNFPVFYCLWVSLRLLVSFDEL